MNKLFKLKGILYSEVTDANKTQNWTEEGSSTNMAETKGNGITQITISRWGESLTIGNEGWTRATTMRPSGGFEMRPMVQVYNIEKEAHAKIWEIVDSIDLEELKKLNSKDYKVVIHLETTNGRFAIKVSDETFETIKPLVKLRDELAKVRDENQW